MNPAAVSVLMVVITVPQVRTVKGQYRHPGRGFAVTVPLDARGLLEGDPRTERGIRIALRSGGSVFVYGEMNALEWRTPAEGVHWTASVHSDRDNCSSSSISEAKVGPLVGAGARLLCNEMVIRYALVFRPGGGPIYWLRLETTVGKEALETKAFDQIAASFRLIHWE